MLFRTGVNKGCARSTRDNSISTWLLSLVQVSKCDAGLRRTVIAHNRGDPGTAVKAAARARAVSQQGSSQSNVFISNAVSARPLGNDDRLLPFW